MYELWRSFKPSWWMVQKFILFLCTFLLLCFELNSMANTDKPNDYRFTIAISLQLAIRWIYLHSTEECTLLLNEWFLFLCYSIIETLSFLFFFWLYFYFVLNDRQTNKHHAIKAFNESIVAATKFRRCGTWYFPKTSWGSFPNKRYINVGVFGNDFIES